jgi:hypothetical protein
MRPIKPSPRTTSRAILLATGLFLALCLISVTALAQIYEAKRELNIREQSDGTGKIVQTLAKGDRVEKTGRAGGFLKVKSKQGKQGYVWSPYLKKVADPRVNVPSFDEFLASLEKRPKPEGRTATGRYFFESVLDFVRMENHPLYVIFLPLLVALFMGVAGVVFLWRIRQRLNAIAPDTLHPSRRAVIKAVVLCGFGYLIARAVLYFVDLALHYAALEENTLLVLILTCPRLLVAGPLAAVDVLAENWIVGISLVLILAWTTFSRWNSESPSETPAGDEPAQAPSDLTTRLPEEPVSDG